MSASRIKNALLTASIFLTKSAFAQSHNNSHENEILLNLAILASSVAISYCVAKCCMAIFCPPIGRRNANYYNSPLATTRAHIAAEQSVPVATTTISNATVIQVGTPSPTSAVPDSVAILIEPTAERSDAEPAMQRSLSM